VIPAIIVGALTAWYLGLRLGVIIAIVTAVALIVASIVPGMSLAVYALVLAWSAALYFFGPKISKASGKSSMLGNVGGSISFARDWAKRVIGRKQL
jgi:EamA domain-containing membrane protein RarD